MPPRPPLPGPGDLDRALDLVRFLRAHCPWDREQTAESLVPHLLEETHEVVDAIREGRHDELEGELGDLLLNLAFQVVVAEEEGRLDAASVYERLERKMIDRHPHLFGEGGGEEAEGPGPPDRPARGVRGPADAGGPGGGGTESGPGDEAETGTRERAVRGWEARKAAERPPGRSVLDGLPAGLDPLTRAHRIQERVAGVGFDWPDHRGALEKVDEELEEVRRAIDVVGTGSGEESAEGPSGRAAQLALEEELGDLLFAVVNLARLAGVHATPALARANRKFGERFAAVERLARERGLVLHEAGLEALDALWEEVKRG